MTNSAPYPTTAKSTPKTVHAKHVPNEEIMRANPIMDIDDCPKTECEFCRRKLVMTAYGVEPCDCEASRLVEEQESLEAKETRRIAYAEDTDEKAT